MKKCSKCGLIKPLSGYYERYPGAYQSVCETCWKLANAVRYMKRKERKRLLGEQSKDGSKQCTECDTVNPLSEFYEKTDGGFESVCKKCWNNASKEYRERKKAEPKKVHTGDKQCSVCGISKPTSAFYARETGGFRSQCKKCFLAKNKERNLRNPEKKRTCDREYYSRNKEKLSADASARYFANHAKARQIQREYYRQNAEKVRSISRQRRHSPQGDLVRANRREHYRRNKDRYVAQAREREMRKKNAVPAWADLDAIATIYAEAARISQETGVKHHVDHIVPLQGKNVCGLHVEANLQILTAKENTMKSNAFGDD